MGTVVFVEFERALGSGHVASRQGSEIDAARAVQPLDGAIRTKMQQRTGKIGIASSVFGVSLGQLAGLLSAFKVGIGCMYGHRSSGTIDVDFNGMVEHQLPLGGVVGGANGVTAALAEGKVNPFRCGGDAAFLVKSKAAGLDVNLAIGDCANEGGHFGNLRCLTARLRRKLQGRFWFSFRAWL